VTVFSQVRSLLLKGVEISELHRSVQGHCLGDTHDFTVGLLELGDINLR
jgi:hypothetical protein